MSEIHIIGTWTASLYVQGAIALTSIDPRVIEEQQISIFFWSKLYISFQKRKFSNLAFKMIRE